MNSALQRPPEPAALTPLDAQRSLVVARARAQAELDALAQRLQPLQRWKTVAQQRPFVAVGLAFALGYALARLTAPPRRKNR